MVLQQNDTLLLQYVQNRTMIKGTNHRITETKKNVWVLVYAKKRQRKKKARTRPQVDSNLCSTGPEASTLPADSLCFAVIICLQETDFQKSMATEQQQHQRRRRRQQGGGSRLRVYINLTSRLFRPETTPQSSSYTFLHWNEKREFSHTHTKTSGIRTTDPEVRRT